MSAYVVDVKPSARRRSGAVGRLVNRGGARHRFDSRDDAETWAAGLSAEDGAHVWIRAANPGDRTGADAYLVSRRPRRATAETRGDQGSLPEAGADAG